MEADFSGYATKAGLKCSDGRTITPEAFKHMDGKKVPLVWQHGHSEPTNVLGHALLEARPDGVYAYGFFNETPAGKSAKTLVQHKDITAMSIYANQLVEKAKSVLHGMIREVSLVLSGANPGALIDNVNIAHGDGEFETLDDEAVIYTGLTLQHSDESTEETEETEESEDSNGSEESDTSVVAHADASQETVKDVYDTLTPKQKEVVDFMIGAALEAAAADSSNSSNNTAQHSDTSDDDNSESDDQSENHEGDLTHQEGTDMTRNVFEQNGAAQTDAPTLSHSQLETIISDAQRIGSLKESFLAHAQEYGIEDIDLLFPDAKSDANGISLISRRMEWVQNVLSATRHSPFSRVKSIAADLTADEARAKGYVKGNLKKDEIIKLLKRVTTPATVYKKQKLDRDDIVDITDLDIVAWLKGEMRVMLDEEIARAVLVGDNRAADDEDKIDEDHIRPIAYDVDMYNTTVNLAADFTGNDLVDAVVNAMDNYKGSGTPTFYTTQRQLTSMLLAKDTVGRRLYPTKADLAGALLVKDVIAVEAMEQDSDLVGVIVNLADYTIGADAGGNVNMFDDFDIDYNQQKYLIETRISGALTRPKAAVTLKMNSGRIVTPQAPTFDSATNVVTIPAQTGVSYVNADTGVTFASGAQPALSSGEVVDIEAQPTAGYGFTHDADTEWTFTGV